MDVEHINFNTIREDFNEYKVENGQILRVKSIMVDLATETENGKSKTRVGLKDFSHVLTTIKIDTSGYEYSTPEQVTENDQIRELQFTTTKENINIYETKKVLVLIGSHVQKIFLTNKKDHASSPIIRYESPCIISILDKNTLQYPINP
jgi:hypothetical protein